MKLKLKCTCGAVFAVDAIHAGKKVKCPTCETIVTIPAAPAQPEPVVPQPEPEPEPPSPDLEDAHMEEGPQLCPSCDKAVDASAVICINCGYNFKTGQQLHTTVEEAPEEVEEEEYDEEAEEIE